MRGCLTCQLVWMRIRQIPASPGRWGKLLSCIIAAGWAASLWDDGPSVLDRTPFLAVLVQLAGERAASVWMAIVATVPVVGMLTNIVNLRIAGATLGLATWGVLLIEIALSGYLFSPAAAGCLVGVLACLNADVRLARHVLNGGL